jgi:hypothetical protein
MGCKLWETLKRLKGLLKEQIADYIFEKHFDEGRT